MLRLAVSFLVFFTILYGCSPKIWQVNSFDENRTGISDSIPSNPKIDNIISPYSKKLHEKMNRILAYNPYDLNKRGYNSSLANYLADLTLEEANTIYQKQFPNKKIDACLLNHGGIRRNFTPGNLTVKSMFELMPFENEAVVVTLTAQKMMEMANYLRKSKRGHPIAGIEIGLSDETLFLINGKPIQNDRNYTIVTNDYLQKGGDRMNFFAKPVKLEPLDIKLRDLFISHVEKFDTIKVNLNKRYIK